MKNKVESSSFRDPSGYIFYLGEKKVMRHINACYFKEYNHLMKSGLYQELVENHLMVEHKEVKKASSFIEIEVEKIPYISYPYEWCFEQLKDAAILTIEINKIAMKYGMILKDSSAYNVQFKNGRAIFIDTLSFMFYEEGSPWGAYGQFTRHFIAPLVLMRYIDPRMNKMLQDYIDGIPLDLCASILGKKGGFISFIHIKMQNKSIQKHNYDGHNEVVKIDIKKQSILNMFDMIERQLNKMALKAYETEWMNYYDMTNYEKDALAEKEKVVEAFCKKIKTKTDDIIFDIGANDGRFSRLVYKQFGGNVLSFDIDSNSVQRNYQDAKENNIPILPLIMDINNPSSAIGFANRERNSFMDRGKASLTMVLAFIHHMVISNNISFEMASAFFSKITKYLIIEFVPKEDSQVQVLLKTRTDIFDHYNLETFKEVFSKDFSILEEHKITNSNRTMFLMEVKK